MSNRHGFLRLTLAAGAAVGAASMGGCFLIPNYDPGGPHKSIDQHTYLSEPHTPLTVTLVDVRDMHEFWSMDVPVGEKLTIRFYENVDTRSPHAPDIMRWQVMPESRRAGRLRNQIAVPPAGARRIDVAVRDPMEYPHGVDAPAAARSETD